MGPQLRASNDHYNAPSKLARFSLARVAWSILDCARRMSTFRACAFREQEDDQATLLLHPLRRILLSRFFFCEPSIQGRQDHQRECR